MFTCQAIISASVLAQTVCYVAIVCTPCQGQSPGLCTSNLSLRLLLIHWNLSETTACGKALSELHKEVAALQSRLQCFSAIWGPGGWLLERWLPDRVTILDRFHCIYVYGLVTVRTYVQDNFRFHSDCT